MKDVDIVAFLNLKVANKHPFKSKGGSIVREGVGMIMKEGDASKN